MKKKLISFLLAVVMAATVLVPLVLTASAASDPIIRIIWKNSGEGYSYKEYKPADFSSMSSAYSGAITAAISGSSLFIKLNGFQPRSASGDYYAIHVKTPSTSWNVMVNATGENRLSVLTSSYFNYDAALATNGTMNIYTSEYNSYLYIYDTVGRIGTTAAVTADRYGIAGSYIDIGSVSANGRRLHLTEYANLNMSGSTSYSVYPFHVTGKNQTATLYGIDFTYNHSANCRHSYGSAPIELEGSTHFLTYFGTINEFSQNWAFYIIRYMKSFTGIMNAELKNAYLYGGPYSCETTQDSVPMKDIFDQMHTATIGDTIYMHKVAKNCPIATAAVSTIPNETLKTAFSLPMAYGYALPEKIERTEFVAKLDWVDDKGNDMDGKTVDYDVKYTARITLVPKRTNLQNKNLNVESELKSIIPSNALGASLATNGNYEPKIYIYYKPIARPALTITKQPVDYYGSGSNKQARFSIDSSDATATYQWQKSTDKNTWTNIKDDITSTGSTRITGSKAKNLTYDFNLVDVGTTLMYFRCIVSRPGDGATVTSNVVKYTYESPSTLTKLLVGGFNDQPGADYNIHDTPYVLSDGKVVSNSKDSTNYKVQIVDHYWFVGEAGATSVVKTTDTKFQEGKHYVYRIMIRATDKAVFSSGMTVFQDGTERQPNYIKKMSDGKWVVDFDFGIVGKVISEVTLNNVVPPYNAMPFMKPVSANEDECKVDKGFTRGWFEMDGSRAPMPQVGEKYYCEYYIYTAEGDAFRMIDGEPDVKFNYYDRDGNLIDCIVDSEYSFVKSNGQPNPRLLCAKVTFLCTATHIIKGGTIKDLDMPTAGVKLDTEVTRTTPQIDFLEMNYYINDEKVKDPANTAPEENDVVKIEFTFREYGEGETKMHFDKDIYTTWYVGGNDAENGVRVYRDTSYPDEDICAFTYIVLVPAAGTHKVTVTDGKTDKKDAKPGETVTITADPAPEGKVFDKWEIVKGTPSIKDLTNASLSFSMPNHDVELKATYKDKSAGEKVMLGDVDNDKKITASDARLALRRAVDLETYPAGSREYTACDVDKDGKVTAGDARKILRAAVSLEDPTKW